MVRVILKASSQWSQDRLFPRGVNTEEGKRNVLTVPVKLCNSDCTLHLIEHKDGTFCTATSSNLEYLASLLGPKQVFSLSTGDKERVPFELQQ